MKREIPPLPPGLSPDTVRAYNSDAVSLFSLYLNMTPRAVDNEMLDELATACGISRAAAYAEILAALAGLDAGGRDRLFFQHWILPAIEEQDPRPYLEDPYFKTVPMTDAVLGKWQLREESLAPCEGFVCRDFRVLPDGRMLPQIGFFRERYPFPAVLEGGREWMTLLPNETVTTKPAIAAAAGRVLTFGLGLGYFAFHAAAKDEVSSVTVVDLSPDVIALFRTHILPHIPHGDKIKLVCADAFAFAEKEMAGRFDFVFADIWHDAGDGKELYLRMRKIAEKHPDITFTYWLEDTIRCYLDPSLWYGGEGK